MFPHLQTLVHQLFANEKHLDKFLTDPRGFVREIPLSEEEQGALLRLRGRLISMAETGALLVSPAGLWP